MGNGKGNLPDGASCEMAVEWICVTGRAPDSPASLMNGLVGWA